MLDLKYMLLLWPLLCILLFARADAAFYPTFEIILAIRPLPALAGIFFCKTLGGMK